MEDKNEFLEPWYSIISNGSLENELKLEVSKDHILFHKKVLAIARREDTDTVLFKSIEESDFFAEVHLTWSGKEEMATSWPQTKVFQSFDDWAQLSMLPANLNYNVLE